MFQKHFLNNSHTMATTVQSSTGTTIPLTLTDEQKQFLYDQGYIILKGVIDKKITSAAKARIKLASENQKKGHESR